MFHEHSHHHIDQHELGNQHEGDEVDRGERRQVAEAVLVLTGAFTQSVLGEGAESQLCRPCHSQEEGRGGSSPHKYLHDPIPVVPGGHSEQCEEGHAEVGEGSVPAQALTGIVLAAL